ncbi:MAG: hypothetical protein KJO98_02115 [Rhodothermia bacterium]|nr:hypothetical protein [Rhodothermia bacterium]
MGRITLLTITVATFAPLLFAAEATAQTVRTYVNVDSISVGERMQLTIAVDQDAPTRQAITFPTPPPDTLGSFLRFGDILIVDVIGSGSTGGENGLLSDSIVYEATTFALDTARATPMPVLMTSGSDTLVLATNAFLVPVRSVVPEDAEDIMDLMPIAEFRQPVWPWLLFLAALLVAMAAFIFWYRRSPQQTLLERSSVRSSIPPDEEAYTRLDGLVSQSLETEADVEQFCVDLSDTLRTYLWRRMAVHALEMTTSELVERVASMEGSGEMTEGVSRTIEDVLKVCDLAKFAEVFPAAAACIEEARRTREIVDRVEEYYTPIPEEIAGADSESAATEASNSHGAHDKSGDDHHSSGDNSDGDVSASGEDSDPVGSSVENRSSAKK